MHEFFLTVLCFTLKKIYGTIDFPVVNDINKNGARSIQPKFPEILVQNSMDRFGPTGKVSKKLVHLLRWTTSPGRTGLNFGWMDRAHEFNTKYTCLLLMTEILGTGTQHERDVNTSRNFELIQETNVGVAHTLTLRWPSTGAHLMGSCQAPTRL